MRQVGALPIRREDTGELSVLLVTSRETARWVIPKGWPLAKRSDKKAAELEAEEEAGVSGKIGSTPLGFYRYFKRLPDGFRIVDVDVFLLEVRKVRKHWPEEHERQRRWFGVEEAVSLVKEPGLKALIAGLAPRRRKVKKVKRVKTLRGSGAAP